jgi:hypothetical protein
MGRRSLPKSRDRESGSTGFVSHVWRILGARGSWRSSALAVRIEWQEASSPAVAVRAQLVRQPARTRYCRPVSNDPYLLIPSIRRSPCAILHGLWGQVHASHARLCRGQRPDRHGAGESIEREYSMKESRIRGLTVEELDVVAGGDGLKKGQVTTTSVINGPGPHDTTVTSQPVPFGQFKKT